MQDSDIRLHNAWKKQCLDPNRRRLFLILGVLFLLGFIWLICMGVYWERNGERKSERLELIATLVLSFSASTWFLTLGAVLSLGKSLFDSVQMLQDQVNYKTTAIKEMSDEQKNGGERDRKI